MKLLATRSLLTMEAPLKNQNLQPHLRISQLMTAAAKVQSEARKSSRHRSRELERPKAIHRAVRVLDLRVSNQQMTVAKKRKRRQTMEASAVCSRSMVR
jgi:hypothetical protein